jgi:hypothetical protein
MKVGQGPPYPYLQLCIAVRNLRTKFEDPSFIIYWDIMHNAKFDQWPLATLQVGQRQPYTYRNFVLEKGT